MTEETAKVLEGWDTRASGGRPLDVAMEMTLLTQRIVVKTMFGADVGANGRRIARAFETALAGVGARFVIPLWMTLMPSLARPRAVGGEDDFNVLLLAPSTARFPFQDYKREPNTPD